MLAQTAYALSYSDSDGFWLVLAAIAGAAGGVALFFRGFRMLKYKRLILNTPFSKVRSASIGLVEVSGMPTGPKTIPAAITGDPCYYYRVKAWQWVSSGKDHKWQQALDESMSVPFFLDDGTGKVLINPQGCDLDVHRNFTDEIQSSRFVPGGIIPENIKKFVALHGLLAGDKVRLEERVIKPGFPLFVFGTLGENSGQTSWTPMPHTTSSRATFGADPLSRSLNFKFNLGQSGSEMAMDMIRDLAPGTNVRIETRVTGTGPVVLPDRVVQELNRMGVSLPVPVVTESSQPQSQSSAGSLATTNTSIAVADPDSASLPTTSDPSRGSANATFDLHPHVALGKGERGDPFTISSQSQREVVQALAWKSALYIWGSPAVSLACIYFLLVYWGWL